MLTKKQRRLTKLIEDCSIDDLRAVLPDALNEVVLARVMPAWVAKEVDHPPECDVTATIVVAACWHGPTRCPFLVRPLCRHPANEKGRAADCPLRDGGTMVMLNPLWND